MNAGNGLRNLIRPWLFYHRYCPDCTGSGRQSQYSEGHWTGYKDHECRTCRGARNMPIPASELMPRDEYERERQAAREQTL